MKKGEIIKAIREQRGLTQAQLASIAGVNSIQISHIETDYISGGKSFIAACKALDIPVEIVVFKTLDLDSLTGESKILIKMMFDQIDEIFNLKKDE